MSSSTGAEKTSGDEARVVATIQHAGTLIEHVSCSSALAMCKLVERCNKEGRRIYPGRINKLPSQPVQRVDYMLTLEGADAIVEHSRPDQVISVQAGISIAALQTLLAKNKQWFPVCLPDENISLMEYINYGSSGPLEHGYGEARDLVLGMQVVLGTGELINCGGKVVKNVTGYDLPKLFAGAHGTLCIPFAAHLRLFALPETSSTMVLHFKDIATAFESARALRRSGLPLSCLEIVDAEIFQLLPEDKRIASLAGIEKNEVIMCVQIHGIATVVAELEKEVQAITEQSVRSIVKLEAAEELSLWKFLAGPANMVNMEWLEFTGSIRQIEQLLSALKDKHRADAIADPGLIMAWTARPGRNKAILLMGNATQKQNPGAQSRLAVLLELLSTPKFLGEESKITTAFADANYVWRVKNLPTDDPVYQELKHRLKLQYDPHGVLNPLVLL